ncbi:MAG: response regulator transcription factor [Prevotella sp.]|nr:response regulator transcription factor [Prevotella sp.]
MNIILADNQDITRAGLQFLLQTFNECPYHVVSDKSAMIQLLKQYADALVIMDYTLFDINDIEELMVLSQRFINVQWIIFSEDLSVDFANRLIVTLPQASILLKESPLGEIRECLSQVMQHRRYICQRMMEMLLTNNRQEEEKTILTKTENEILKDIALGMTTKEIAEKRFSSFHTVNTHRKNIFRKLNVNNVHEATKYALRAGLVDSAEYYI